MASFTFSRDCWYVCARSYHWIVSAVRLLNAAVPRVLCAVLSILMLQQISTVRYDSKRVGLGNGHAMRHTHSPHAQSNNAGARQCVTDGEYHWDFL